MIRFYLLCPVFTLLASISQAQVAAGVSDGLMIGQHGIQLNTYAFNFGDYDEKFDSLDFNNDGRYDANFTAQAANIFDFTGAGTGVYALHPKFEMMVDTNGAILPLALGDSITSTKTWSQSTNDNLFAGIFHSDFWGVGGHFAFGNWISGQSAFAGIRVTNAMGDTLYGWMFVTSWISPNSTPNATLAVGSTWAIQLAPVNTSAGEAISDGIRVSPNPAGDLVEFYVAGQPLDHIMVRLFDLQGHLVREASLLDEKGILHLNDLPAGIYVWELAGEGWHKSGKLLRQK